MTIEDYIDAKNQKVKYFTFVDNKFYEILFDHTGDVKENLYVFWIYLGEKHKDGVFFVNKFSSVQVQYFFSYSECLELYPDHLL